MVSRDGNAGHDALFATARLQCRRWRPEDLDAIFAIYSDEEGARWVDDGQPIGREACEGWMEVTLANYRTRGYGMFAVAERSSGEIAGCCGLVHPGGQKEAEVKYAFHRSRWGRGYASEIVPALLEYGRREHGIRSVIATVAPQNHASRRVLVKSGLRFLREMDSEEGTLVYEWHSLPDLRDTRASGCVQSS